VEREQEEAAVLTSMASEIIQHRQNVAADQGQKNTGATQNQTSTKKTGIIGFFM
jgi:hypothetical protein